MRFVFSGKDRNPSIKNVCVITESTTSTRDSENEIRVVASIIQRRIFTAYSSKSNLDYAGYCEYKMAGDGDEESGFQRDLSTCFSGDIRDSDNQESNGGSLYKNSEKYNSVLTCVHEVFLKFQLVQRSTGRWITTTQEPFFRIFSKIIFSFLMKYNVRKNSLLVQMTKF